LHRQRTASREAAAGGRVAHAGCRAQYEVHYLQWQDPSRERTVPAKLYLPARASGPVPLVVFSHGIGGSREGYTYLGKYWAANGYASLHLQHTGSDRNLWAGNPLALVTRLQGAAQEAEAMNRARDVSFALDQLLAGGLAARIDPLRIAAAGHSYGANTTLLAAGAQVVRDGRAMDLADARIRAAVVISAPPFYGEADPQAILRMCACPRCTSRPPRTTSAFPAITRAWTTAPRCMRPPAARARRWRCSRTAPTACSPTGWAPAARSGTRRSRPPRASWRWISCARCLE
jgi:dienelactone hydrolase